MLSITVIGDVMPDKEKTITFSVCVPESLHKRIEEERGKMKRSTFVWDTLEKYFGVGDHEGEKPLKEFEGQEA